jgi:hypothetical protein
VSELFNKSGLFENRELLDNLAYLILCHETIRDFEIENYYSSHFLKPNLVFPPQKAPVAFDHHPFFCLGKGKVKIDLRCEF